MYTWLIIITVLALLYGLAWHNQPAKEREHDDVKKGATGAQAHETR